MKKFFTKIFAIAALLTVSSSLYAADYGLPAKVHDGNILHCFDWPISTVTQNLQKIAEQGFGSVQLSPLQRPDIRNGENWYAAYSPYDIAFKESAFFGTREDLKTLCTEAHKLGIKVIVDVVANHIDKTSGYHDPWWENSAYYHSVGDGANINYNDRRSITHDRMVGGYDVNSENAEVIARAKAYVQDLASMGVDGIRWDGAKHIALPEESFGGNFWKEVTSVGNMYHYGEILDAPGPDASIITNYAKYMDFTDNRYSNYAANNNGGIPNGYGGQWAANYSLGSQCIYWGESHDTYCNDEWSQNKDQSVIDRAYAAMASRNDACGLYFIRPTVKGRTSIKMGTSSTTAWQGKAIAEVNKFRNRMSGKADYFSNNGNGCSITRQGGGAVIVMKTSGYFEVPNGGSYVPAGTYTDRVSGATFTVDANTIKGTVGSSGIAVIYNDYDDDLNPGGGGGGGDVTDPNQPFTVYFDNSSSNWTTPHIHYWGGTESTWPGVAMTMVKDNVWSYTVPAGTTGCLFNAGDGDPTKTADFVAQANHIYTTSGDQGVYTDSGDNGNGNGNGNGNNGNYPSTVYMMGHVDGFAWASNKGLAASGNNGSYVYNNVTINDGENGYGFFSFASKLSATDGDWDGVNSGDRYGATAADELISVDIPATVRTFQVNVDASSCYSWKLEAGTYNITLNLANSTVTVSKPGSGVDHVELETNAPVEYFNLQGVKVAEPTQGIYIRRQGDKVSKVVIR